MERTPDHDMPDTEWASAPEDDLDIDEADFAAEYSDLTFDDDDPGGPEPAPEPEPESPRGYGGIDG